MSISIQTMSDLNSRARRTLIDELGAVDTIRFLNQFRAGDGNYTTEREQLFKDESVKDIVDNIKAQRSSNAE